ncbi:MAG TPA: hypothetical protein VGL40_12140 [Bacillota bacterium]
MAGRARISLPRRGRPGVNFAIITDHNTLGGLKAGKEGYYQDTLVLFGVELNSARRPAGEASTTPPRHQQPAS